VNLLSLVDYEYVRVGEGFTKNGIDSLGIRILVCPDSYESDCLIKWTGLHRCSNLKESYNIKYGEINEPNQYSEQLASCNLLGVVVYWPIDGDSNTC
jgi:hypothetical protein